MKSNWETRPLGELVKFSSGGTPSKKNPEYWNGTIPWISAKTMKDERVSTSDLMITEEGLTSGSKLAPIGSLLLLTRGSGLFNGIPLCIVEQPVAFNQDVKCIESCTDVSNQFIFYWLKSQEQYLKAKLEVTGIGAGKFDTKFLQELNVPVPPKDERDKIVAIAEAISKKIIVNTKINDNLQQQAVALYRSFFVDFERVSTQERFPSEFGAIPAGWCIKTLAEVTTNIRTRVRNHSYKVLSAINSGCLQPSEEYFTKQVFSKDISNYIVVEENDFAYNPARVNIGSIGLNTQGYIGCVSPVYVVFRTEPEYHYFMDFFIKSARFKEEVRVRASGSVRQAMNYTDLGLIKIAYPPLSVVRQFNEEYETIVKCINRNLEENAVLASIRDSLIPKLLSGEIDLSSVEF